MTTHPSALATPRNHTEETLLRIWRQVLGKEGIGIHDNFFDLGGNSLLAMQLISNVWRSLGVDLPMRQLFDAPTIAGLAETIDVKSPKNQPRQGIPLRTVPRVQGIPLSHTQERLWNGRTIYVDRGAGNIGRFLRLRGRLQFNALEQALSYLIARHESLRTSVTLTPAGEPVQVIHPQGAMTIPIVDLSGLESPDQEREARRLAEEEATRAFSLTQSTLMRMKLLRLSQEEHWMIFAIQHMVVDGWSLNVLFRELGEIYTATCRGKQPDLPLLPIQFADYAIWQRQHLQSELTKQSVSYWKKCLTNPCIGLRLPFDHPRPEIPTFQGKRETVFLSPDLQKPLSKLGQEVQASEFMVLLAAFKLLLHLYTGQVDIMVGSSDSNRNQIETVNVIGFLADPVLYRSNLTGNPTFLELLGRVREVVLGASQNHGVSYLEMVKHLKWQGDLGSHPNQCCFFEATDTNLDVGMDKLEVQVLPREQVSMWNDLRVYVGKANRGLEVRLDYSTDLFKPDTIHLMVKRYHSLLEQIVFGPNKCLSDFSLDSLDKRQQALASEQTTKKTQAAGGTTTHPSPLTTPCNPTEE